MNRLHSVSIQIGALLSSTCGVAPDAESLYLVDSMPIPMCHPLRHGRVTFVERGMGMVLVRPPRAGSSASSCMWCVTLAAAF